ncbi:MAG: outer membrane beta-barrel protein [Burkholderiaceae bacterium]
MSASFRAFTAGAVAAAALGVCCGAAAQSTRTGMAGGVGIGASSTKSGESFIGVNIGKATYNTSCGVAGLTCQNNVTSYSVTAGNMFSENFGAELSLLNFGTASRAGGGASARGINLSAVGRLPLGDSFGLEGKLGTTYGITHVNAAALSGVSSGRAKGFGLGYGVALDVNISRGLKGALGWEQHDFHFAGQGTSNVKNVTVGLAYRF